MMNPTLEINILPFQLEDQAEARELILKGLAEHWGWLDPKKNQDLENIGAKYGRGVFLVAWQGNRMVGTGALVPRPEASAEIVRMSVVADMRSKGIGGQILRALCEQARTLGVRHVVLETTETWTEVIRFYRKFGFQETHHLNGDVYFELEL